MLGDAGASAAGVSEWREVRNMGKKTLQMYSAGPDQSDSIAAAVFEVHGAMELDVDNPDTETDYFLLGTIDNAGRILSIDHNVGFIRVKMTTAPANNVQVGLQTHGA
jgi:hypothetical protein